MHTPTITKGLKAFIANGILTGMVVSNPVNALIILDQPGSTLPGLRSTSTSGLSGRGIYDDFQLASDFTLTRIEWTGGLVSFSSPSGTINPPNVGFFGGIAEDLLGQPDGPVVLNDISSPIEVFLSSSSLPGGITTVVNRYSVDLSNPVTLHGGQKYWLGINASFVSLPSDSSLEWDWAFGSGGNGQALVYNGSIPRTPVANDFSFTLIGSAIPASVPEPGMPLLFGIGVGAFYLSRRLNSPNVRREPVRGAHPRFSEVADGSRNILRYLN